MPQPQNNDASQSRPNPPPSPSPSTGETRNEAVDALKQGLTSGARELSTEVKHVATDLVGEARHVAEDKLRDGKNFAGDQLGTVAWALRNTSDALRTKESGITEYVEKAAASIDDVSIYLSTRTLSQLINDAESFARREPAIFLGGAFFAGLLGGRFFKAAKPTASTSGGGGAMRGRETGATHTTEPERTNRENRQKTSPVAGNGSGAPGGNGTGGPDHGSKAAATPNHPPSTPRPNDGPGAS
jgi:hypothetical protein